MNVKVYAVPTVPFGGVPDVIVGDVQLGLIVIWYCVGGVLFDALSVACRLNVLVPDPLGAPLIVHRFEENPTDKPVGKLPVTTEHADKLPVPLTVTTLVEYA